MGSGICTSRRFNALGAMDDGSFFQTLYCCIMTNTDDWGIVEADPHTLKMVNLPGDERDHDAFQRAIEALHHVGLGTLYQYRGQFFFEVWDFDEGQMGWIREDRRRPGAVPRYSKEDPETTIPPGLSRMFPENPGNSRLTLPCPKPYPEPYPALSGGKGGDVPGNSRKFQDAEEVFEYWKEVAGKGRSALTPGRREIIGERLGEGYTVEQLKAAVVGNKYSPYHQGNNEAKKVYDDLTIILRKSNVDRFISDGERITARSEDCLEAERNKFTGRVIEDEFEKREALRRFEEVKGRLLPQHAERLRLAIHQSFVGGASDANG